MMTGQKRIAALVHHKADIVPVDAIRVAVDLTATCLLMFILTELFGWASIRRVAFAKTIGELEHLSIAALHSKA